MEKLLQFATKAIIIKDDKILALYLDNKDGKRYWDLPGGRIEFGETPEEGLIREIDEELGCSISIIELIDTWNHFPNENWQIVGVFYLCKLKDYNIVLSDEHTGFHWIPLEALSKEFSAEVFLKRMQNWNWEELIECITSSD